MPIYVKAVVFTVGSGYFIWLSRRSILLPRSHGFYRFFAFEFTLALVLLNLDYWFRDWLSGAQLVSWVLLSASAYFVLHGALTLHRLGKSRRDRGDQTLIGIEKTTKVVSSGIYTYIRHPIYSSAIVGICGVTLKDVSIAGVSLAIVSMGLFVATAKVEETENIRYFGEEYRHYMERTKMFIPYLI